MITYKGKTHGLPQTEPPDSKTYQTSRYGLLGLVSTPFL
jgi:hypothetical protein